MRYKISPTPGMILVSPMPEEDRTASGLYLPGARDNSIFIGKVEAINPPVSRVAGETDPDDYFKVGDMVLIGKWAGTEVSIRQNVVTEKYILINEDSILATLTEETEDGSSSEAN